MPTQEEMEHLRGQRDMLLQILANVPAAGLADALYEAGYDPQVTVPMLRAANADLSLYMPAREETEPQKPGEEDEQG